MSSLKQEYQKERKYVFTFETKSFV